MPQHKNNEQTFCPTRVEQSNTDAMDGLSDSDLETLLKNFNELSAEEQHSLIAYLKKLEAKEPERVERLRQYVSSAASTAPPAREPPAAEPARTVVLESDDDDYTVEEVLLDCICLYFVCQSYPVEIKP